MIDDLYSGLGAAAMIFSFAVGGGLFFYLINGPQPNNKAQIEIARAEAAEADARKAKYHALEELIRNYSGKMTPEQFREYASQFGLVKIINSKK